MFLILSSVVFWLLVVIILLRKRIMLNKYDKRVPLIVQCRPVIFGFSLLNNEYVLMLSSVYYGY